MYITKYDGGGHLWPIVFNTTVFSLLVAQIIALGVFGLKRSTVASGFTIPLLIGTVLFNQYCRQRFLPVFRNNAAQVQCLALTILPSTPLLLISHLKLIDFFVIGSY